MPHILIEHSDNFKTTEIINLSQKIQQEMPQIQGANFSLEACKTRSFSFENYLVGSKNQENSNFIHITIKILEGRSAAIKQQLAQIAAQTAQKFLENFPKKARNDISVDIVDMSKETYQKITI